MKRPLIGVTGPARGGAWAWRATRSAIERAGGRALRLVAGTASASDADRLDGLVLGGGDDVHPARYGAAPRPERRYDTARDALELELLARVERRRRPVLGICRGAQLLNVAHGGTLAEVRERTGSAPRRRLLPLRMIRLVAGGFLARATGRRALRVNALHRQCIDEVGAELCVDAHAGPLVQAIRGEHVVGVQWHPELIARLPAQARLLRAFVRAAS